MFTCCEYNIISISGIGLHVLIGELVNDDVYGQRIYVYRVNGPFLNIIGLGSEWVRKSKPGKRTPCNNHDTPFALKKFA